MTSSSDIAVLLTSDGQEWGAYIAEGLNGVPHVSCTTVDLEAFNDTPKKKRQPEVHAACQQCSVTLLLATPGMLSHMQKNAGWFAPTLRDFAFNSSLVVLLLSDRKHLDDVTQNHGYVTGEWKYRDAGDTYEEVQQRLAEVLDIVDQSRQAGRARVFSSSSTTSSPGSPKAFVELFPATVFQRNTRVAVVFKKGVRGEVTVKVEQMDTPLTAVQETTTVFTFTAPQKPSGKYSVRVYVNGKQLRDRPELTYRGTEVEALTSPRYLAQVLRLDSDEELDLRLRDLFNRSLPADHHGLNVLFHHLPQTDPAGRQKNADSHFPTLLHYAAAFGLSEFCAALLDCPGSARAFCIRNCDGMDPAELAAENEFYELEDYILDFMELQAAATQTSGDGHDDHYMDMNGCLTDSESHQESVYWDPVDPPGTGRLPQSPTSQTPQVPALPPRPERTMSSRTPPPHTPPSSPRHWTVGSVSPTSPPASCSPDLDRGHPSSSEYFTVWSVRHVQRSSAAPTGVIDRPPMPPPRDRQRSRFARLMSCPAPVSQPVKEEDQQDQSLVGSLPEVSRLDPVAFMGMDNGQSAAVTPELPAGALGSRSQSELLEIQEMVKNQEISQHQAQMLFRCWKQRYGRNTAASFKDRQKGLQTIKTEFQKRSQGEHVRQSESSSSGPMYLLARFLFGGRHRKQPSYKINISEPVLAPAADTKGPRVYSRAGSDSQLVIPAADNRDSAYSSGVGSSRDSGCSQRLRRSKAKGGHREAKVEEPVLSRRTGKKAPKVKARMLSDSQLCLEAADRDSANSLCTSSSDISHDSGCSQHLRHSAVSSCGESHSAVLSNGDPEAEIEEDDVFDSEDVCRRDHQTKASAKKRQSLGDMYLQQARGQTQREERSLPPLPAIYRPSPKGATTSHCPDSDTEATHL